MVATALAPWAGAALAEVLGGYPVVFVLLAGLAALAAALAAGSVPARSQGAGTHHPPAARGE
jgi:predicted MFS family arabinose efflux permease